MSGHPTHQAEAVQQTARDAASALVIAVDGTSGSGKSSTSRGVADRLGMRYLDTGAMFRAVTWWMLQHGVDIDDQAAVAAKADEPSIESGTDPLGATITLDGVDVSREIRTDAVNAAVSPVAVVPAVRHRLADLQRQEIRAALAAGTGIVVEGRDIGSEIWPDAQIKLHMTADPAARAKRRAAEEGGTDAAAVQRSLEARDRIDSTRKTAPLVAADGAVLLDTTPYSLDEVIDVVVGLVEESLSKAGA